MTTVVIPVYEDVTHLDFTGPHQFLARTPDTTVVVASAGGQPVTSAGLTFSGLADLDAITSCDVLCVPGGWGCVAAIEDPSFVASIRRLGESATYVTSVCTGSLLLGAAGLLEGRRAACHWAWRDMLVGFGAIPDPGRVVRDGAVLTGGGVTAGIDFALTLIEELRGPAVAQALQLSLEYAPEPPFEAGRPELAPAFVRESVSAGWEDRLADARERLAAVAQRATVTT